MNDTAQPEFRCKVFKYLMLLSAFIFFSEAFVMVLLRLVDVPEKIAVFVDPLLLLILVAPPLYYFTYRPLLENLCRSEETEVLLRNDRRMIEDQFKQRTKEVTRKNEELILEITERKKVERELREKGEFLRVVIDSLEHPFYVIDTKTYEVKLANKAAGFGDSFIGGKCYRLTHGKSEPCCSLDHPCSIAEVLKSRVPVIVEHLHHDEQGNEKLVEVHAHPIFGNNDELIDIVEFVMEKNRQSLSPHE